MNFTHVEILPVMEHPFYGSSGYQTTGTLRRFTDTFPLQPLVKHLAVNIYAGPSDQLSLSFTTDSGIPGLTKERGFELAGEKKRFEPFDRSAQFEESKGKDLAQNCFC